MDRRRYISLIHALVVLSVLPVSTLSQQDLLEKYNETHQFEIQGARVTRVIDGDTIEIRQGTMEERVRYIGIDTPERGRPYYKEAKESNEQLVLNKLVTLKMDVQLRDRWGRLLAYVYLQDEDETFVNAVLVAEGYARIMTVPPNVKHSELFLKLERKARDEGKGLWGPNLTSTVVMPREFIHPKTWSLAHDRGISQAPRLADIISRCQCKPET